MTKKVHVLVSINFTDGNTKEYGIDLGADRATDEIEDIYISAACPVCGEFHTTKMDEKPTQHH